MLHWYGCVNK
jgi:hypothetical protein